EEEGARITVFDGLEKTALQQGEQPAFKAIDDETALPLLTAKRGLVSTLKAAVIASMLERGQKKQLAHAVLQRLATSTYELRSIAEEGVSRVAAREAITRYADGGPLPDFERALERIGELSGTHGAKVAGNLLAALRAPRPPEPAATTPLDVLVWAR